MNRKHFVEYAFISCSQADNVHHLNDNVAIAKRDIPDGVELSDKQIRVQLRKHIPVGGFFALHDIEKGKDIVTFGIVIGKATQFIENGSQIQDGENGNIEIIKSTADALSSFKGPEKTYYDPFLLKRTFQGFRCKVTRDGKVGGGTENLVAIVNTVKCSAVAAKNIAQLAKKKFLNQYPNVTDVIAITHESGCGMPDGQSKTELLRIITRIMNHPNIRAVYLLGLGCEHLTPCEEMPENILPALRSEVIDFENRVLTGYLQKYSSEIEAIQKIAEGPVRELMENANAVSREPLPLSYLKLGLKCGGSDIFSGICSNPVLGKAVDFLIMAGGAAIITETPEFDGYMHVLTRRARNEKVAKKLSKLLDNFHKTSQKYPIRGAGRQKVAPGNKKGGLLNIFIKSASAAQKCGTSAIEGILDYCDSLYEKNAKGVWVLDCPSYDQISTPALSLSGAQMVAFTTGLGTPIGSALGQVIKIGNRQEIGLKEHIDFFAEDILHGRTLDEVGKELFELIIDIASGNKTTKVDKVNKEMEKLGLSEQHNEFMSWKRWGDN